jgi:hypothetical protein
LASTRFTSACFSGGTLDAAWAQAPPATLSPTATQIADIDFDMLIGSLQKS